MQKKEYTLGGGEEALPEGALGPVAVGGTLGLFLLPTGRPGCHFTGVDDKASTVTIAALFLLLQGRPRPHCSIGAPRFRRDPPALAMETRVYPGETLDEKKKKMMMRRRKNLIWVFTLTKRALFISTY
jgi:hypothetical protein